MPGPRRIRWAALLLWLASSAAPAAGCEAALAANDAQPGLPPGLLRAVARVESGGNPFAFNVAGEGFFAASRAEAVDRVAQLVARGTRSIDVGCMQINLLHHPTAFTTLDEAFDPARNVAYAVRFLRDLHARHGDWSMAIARYHSAEPGRGEAYLQRVNLAMGDTAPLMSGVAGGRPSPVIDRVVVMMTPAAMQVRVIRPSRSVSVRPARL